MAADDGQTVVKANSFLLNLWESALVCVTFPFDFLLFSSWVVLYGGVEVSTLTSQQDASWLDL